LRDKYRLELIPIYTKNQETIRIYSEVEKSCERLNIYATDFFETLNILKEGIESGKNNEGELNFLLGKIDEINTSMEEISRAMPDLVALVKFS